jgi:BirA family biotin operon repressor/biotin-[acetyl-CoA-carboxylase] ligase
MIEKKVIFLNSVDSTNRYVLDLPEKDKCEGLVVRAEEQTAGRGRLRRKWASPAGKGLWLSVLWRQVWPSEKNYLLTFAAALATARAIEETAPCRPELKWPNDVLVDRKKVAGILLEQRGKPGTGQWVVVGIGLNVEQKKSDFTDAYGLHATSLRVACGKAPQRERIFERLLSRLKDYYTLYKAANESILRRDFLASSKIWGEKVRLIQGKRVVEGRAAGIDDHGGIVIKTEGRTQAFYAGDLILKEWWLT